MRPFAILGGLAVLAACDTVTPEQMAFANLQAETRRDVREAFYEIPFTEGRISVLVTEAGELRSYALAPCAQRVCSHSGRAGSLTRTPDYWVVAGAYTGRTFYLAPGGDGYMLKGGQYIPLAWD